MPMSDAGLADLIADEGEVLHAYRDVVGVLTIGVGLTAASGVVTPKVGMTITREQSRQLLRQALARNYEPAVAKRMPGVAQHVFDPSVSFHFNTGGIGRASWVGRFLSGDMAGAKAAFLSWNKGGGRVIRGLELRREREWHTLSTGRYHNTGMVGSPATFEQAAERAMMKRGDRGEDVERLQRDLAALGYYAGTIDGQFGPATDQAVRRFQGDHPNLTVDGKAGTATLTTIKREQDARAKIGRTTAGGVAAEGAALGNGAAGQPLSTGVPLEWLLVGLAAVTVAILCWQAWQYRDEICAWWTAWRRRRAEGFRHVLADGGYVAPREASPLGYLQRASALGPEFFGRVPAGAITAVQHEIEGANERGAPWTGVESPEKSSALERQQSAPSSGILPALAPADLLAVYLAGRLVRQSASGSGNSSPTSSASRRRQKPSSAPSTRIRKAPRKSSPRPKTGTRKRS